MFKDFSIGQVGNLMENYKTLFVVTIILGLVLSTAGCGLLGTTLKKGTKVEKIGQSGNWVNVKLPSGESGHIFHELVKEVE
jgi:hypothetical protein